MAISKRILVVVAVIVFGAATASAEPVRKNANGCTVIGPPAPKVSRVARGTAPSVTTVFELYVSVGQDLKRVRELRGQDATDDLVVRFRVIQIQRATETERARLLTADELLALQQMIAKRMRV
jgi:hypothetical protein